MYLFHLVYQGMYSGTAMPKFSMVVPLNNVHSPKKLDSGTVVPLSCMAVPFSSMVVPPY